MSIRIIKKPCDVFRAECPHCHAILEYDVYDASRDDMQCPCCGGWFAHRIYGTPVRESENTE